MPGYLERINKLKMAGKLESTPNTPSRGGDLGNETNEINEKRPDILDRLHEGHSWLVTHHTSWLMGDSNAASDAEFSRVWNGWWELDRHLRDQYGFKGCISGALGCPPGFPCQGCADAPTPAVTAQLALA